MTLRLFLCFVSILVFEMPPAANAQQPTPQPEAGEAFAGRWRDLALTEDSEAGFQRFMRMAQTGQLGNDVTNANIGIFKNHARVELVRGGAPGIALLLTPKQTTEGVSRYFDIDPLDQATASDVARVAKALDEAFADDPFRLAYDFFDALPAPTLLPSLGEAWSMGGFRGVLRVLTQRTASLVSVSYTVGVLVTLATALLASLWLLWTTAPPRP